MRLTVIAKSAPAHKRPSHRGTASPLSHQRGLTGPRARHDLTQPTTRSRSNQTEIDRPIHGMGSTTHACSHAPGTRPSHSMISDSAPRLRPRPQKNANGSEEGEPRRRRRVNGHSQSPAARTVGMPTRSMGQMARRMLKSGLRQRKEYVISESKWRGWTYPNMRIRLVRRADSIAGRASFYSS